MIYLDQPLTINIAVTESGVAVDITGMTVRIDYWLPANKGIAPSGTWAATATDESGGLASYSVAEDILSTAGAWRMQAVLVATNGETPAETETVIIYDRGA